MLAKKTFIFYKIIIKLIFKKYGRRPEHALCHEHTHAGPVEYEPDPDGPHHSVRPALVGPSPRHPLPHRAVCLLPDDSRPADGSAHLLLRGGDGPHGL